MMRNAPARIAVARFRSPLAAVALLAGAIRPASAYVIVTAENHVYEVPVKPDVRGDLVLFTLNGRPMSLRIYEVNIAKTNELNRQMDSGTTAAQLMGQVKSLPAASPADDRMIASSRMDRYMESENIGVPRPLSAENAMALSFSSDVPGPRESSSSRRAQTSFADDVGRPAARREPERASPFEAEARRAMKEARRETAAPAPRPAAPVAPAAAPQEAAPDARVADLDSQIQAEQGHLRQLTAGEVQADDLDREIEKSMDKIRHLQKRREALAGKSGGRGAAPAPAAPTAEAPARIEPTGNYPAGSREAKWEQELSEAQARLDRLKQQQSALGSGATDERAVLDELIGETQHDVDRLQKKLEHGAAK